MKLCVCVCFRSVRVEVDGVYLNRDRRCSLRIFPSVDANNEVKHFHLFKMKTKLLAVNVLHLLYEYFFQKDSLVRFSSQLQFTNKIICLTGLLKQFLFNVYFNRIMNMRERSCWQLKVCMFFFIAGLKTLVQKDD